MNLLQQGRKLLTAAVLILVLSITTACSSGNVAQVDRTTNSPAISSAPLSQIERGNTPVGQSFGDWVVQTSKGLLKDAYVRDNDKLGVVISDKVPPNDVRPLARSLVEGFRKNFPNRDLKVLVYAPDKQLILTADYDVDTNRVQYT